MVYGELYRQFNITSYEMLPRSRFTVALAWLREWYKEVIRPNAI
jgi:hypothetical protein